MGLNVNNGIRNQGIGEKFLQEMTRFYQTGQAPDTANQDVAYGLQLQKKQMDAHGISMQYEFEPSNEVKGGSVSNENWNDERYIGRMDYHVYQMKRTFLRNQKKISDSKDPVYFYQMVTDVRNHDVVEADTYVCPGCGAVSTIKDLTKGCSYCGNYFAMTDLFPKITNFFFLKAVVGSSKK